MIVSHRPTPTENRLILLLILDKLGACSAQQLLTFTAEGEIMDYIELQIGLADLTDAGMLRTREHEIGKLYSLSQSGRDTLSMFIGHIPNSRRERVEALCGGWKARISREKHVLADWREEGDGFVVRLRLLEQDMTLLDLRLNVPTRAQAGLMCKRWEGRAGDIYAGLIHSLGEDEGDVRGEE